MLAVRVCCVRIPSLSRCSWTPSRNASFIRREIQNKKQEIGPVGYLLGTIPVVSFCLGCWQVQRRKRKLGLIQELEEKTALPPVDLPQRLEEVQDLEFRKVRVRGRFDHTREMYIQPRSLIKDNEDQRGTGLGSRGQVGSWVVTPFRLVDRECSILVNRGWVPRGKAGHNWKPETKTNPEEDQVDLVGIVRLTEKRLPLGSKHLTSDNVRWNRRDVESMAQVSGCTPIFIDAVAENNRRGDDPIGGQTKVTLRNEHVSYIITWYSLSAATAALWYMKFLKRVV